MDYFRTVFLSAFLLLCCAHLVVPSENASVPTSNAVSLPVYDTDFENVTKQDAHRLNMGIANEFTFQGEGGAAMWIEGLDRKTPGITCHSGTRCVGMEITNVTASRRMEFNILSLENLVGNQLFVSVWLYLPANWQLHLPAGEYNWYEVADAYFTGSPTYDPYGAIGIDQADSSKQVFELGLENVVNGKENVVCAVTNFALPRGQWFNLQYYVFRDATNGIIRVWVDGKLLCNAGNIPTESSSIVDWFTTPAKIYYDSDDRFSPYQIWIDDLQIYNMEPNPITTSVSLNVRLDTSSAPPTVLISGSIYPAPGRPVNVTLEYSNSSGGTYEEMANITSEADGTFSYSWKALGGGVFLIRAEAQGTMSPVVSLGISSVPGFPFESLVAGLVIGLTVLVVVRRRRSSSQLKKCQR